MQFHTTLGWFHTRPDLPPETEMSQNQNNLTKATQVLHWYLKVILVIQKT